MRSTFIVIADRESGMVRISKVSRQSPPVRAVFKSHYEYYSAERVDLQDLLRATKHKTANEAHAGSRGVICAMGNDSSPRPDRSLLQSNLKILILVTIPKPARSIYRENS